MKTLSQRAVDAFFRRNPLTKYLKRNEVCGHEREDIRARGGNITVLECRDCQHSWRRIDP